MTEHPPNQPCVILLADGQYAIARLLPSSILVPGQQLDSPAPSPQKYLWFVEDPPNSGGGLRHLDTLGRPWEVTKVVKVLKS